MTLTVYRHRRIAITRAGIARMNAVSPLSDGLAVLAERAARYDAKRDTGTWVEAHCGDQECPVRWIDQLDTSDGDQYRHWHRIH